MAKIPGTDKTKKCSKCGEVKELNKANFGTRDRGRAIKSECRKCANKQYSKWSVNNPDLIRNKNERRKNLEASNSLMSGSQLRCFKPLLFDSQKGKCYICGDPVTIESIEVDHRIPVTRGGTDNLVNLGGACVFCNRNKHNKTYEEYIAWLTETNHIYK